MAVTLTLTGKTPGQSQFGLDTFTERYKCDATADVVLTDPSVPQKLSVHPDYAYMFLTDRRCAETGEKASELELIYQGSLTQLDGFPVLPPAQHIDSDAIQSATSSRSNTGRILSSPLTVQYYAPTKQLVFITYGSEGSRGTVADPTDSIRVISLQVGDTNYLPDGVLATVVSEFFSEQINDTINSPEVVAGQFWQNTEIKTKMLVPFLFSVTPGDFILMFAPGSGYTIGNTLTVTDGSHTATLTVESLGIGGSVVGYSVVSNSFNYTSGAIIATGGSGSGAGFSNYHIS